MIELAAVATIALAAGLTVKLWLRRRVPTVGRRHPVLGDPGFRLGEKLDLAYRPRQRAWRIVLTGPAPMWLVLLLHVALVIGLALGVATR